VGGRKRKTKDDGFREWIRMTTRAHRISFWEIWKGSWERGREREWGQILLTRENGQVKLKESGTSTQWPFCGRQTIE